MKQFSNTYIFIFSSIMVISVAAILSVISIQLKPIQNRNEKNEKMKSILSSVKIESTDKDVQEKYDKYITDSYVIGTDGKVIEDKIAFNVDMKKELSKIQKLNSLQSALTESKDSPFKEFLAGFIQLKQTNTGKIRDQVDKIRDKRELPVYVARKDGKYFYIFPLRGKGLWGPIWGYVSLRDDFNTIYGVTFDHKSETPGLGAEINTDWFGKQFNDKQLFKDGEFVSVDVVKGGTPESNTYGVDAISGGTITSKGLEDMIYDCLSSYQRFFKLKKQENE